MLSSPPSLVAYIAALLQVLGFGGLAIAIVRTRPAIKKIAAEREANLLSERAAEMSSMRERIERLETARDQDRREFEAKLAAERQAFEERLAAERKEMEERAERERAKASRQIARYRHKSNNLQQAFDALLMLLKRIPETEPIVAEVMEMRKRHATAEALESRNDHDASVAGATE